jgi:hypothetical protein
MVLGLALFLKFLEPSNLELDHRSLELKLSELRIAIARLVGQKLFGTLASLLSTGLIDLIRPIC